MGPQNGGRYRQVVAIRRWPLPQVWLYTYLPHLNDQLPHVARCGMVLTTLGKTIRRSLNNDFTNKK